MARGIRQELLVLFPLIVTGIKDILYVVLHKREDREQQCKQCGHLADFL